MKVLLIESDEATREALIELLQMEWPNMEFLLVENGEAGLALVAQQNVDLILFDLSQGGSSLNTHETGAALRRTSISKQVPIIAIISTSIMGNGHVMSLSETFNAWLLKPFSADRLYQVVSPFAFDTV